jgi:hypothetical protein
LTFSATHILTGGQETVFSTISPAIYKWDSGGLNVTIIAYGQTGSGKTHTMIGSSDSPGILRTFCSDLAVPKGSPPVVLKCFEVYKEDVYDLTQNATPKMTVVDSGGHTFPAGCNEVECGNGSELLDAIIVSMDRRNVGETKMNVASSR